MKGEEVSHPFGKIEIAAHRRGESYPEPAIYTVLLKHKTGKSQKRLAGFYFFTLHFSRKGRIDFRKIRS